MDVFEAVADETRRDLLDRLRREGPASVTELASGYPMSRQAVTKHLDVLARTGLIRVRRVGRSRIHELESAPLRGVEEWLQPFAAEWDRRLERLQRHLEEK